MLERHAGKFSFFDESGNVLIPLVHIGKYFLVIFIQHNVEHIRFGFNIGRPRFLLAFIDWLEGDNCATLRPKGTRSKLSRPYEPNGLAIAPTYPGKRSRWFLGEAVVAMRKPESLAIFMANIPTAVEPAHRRMGIGVVAGAHRAGRLRF